MATPRVPRSYIIARVKGGWIVGGKFCRGVKDAQKACEKEDTARGFTWDMPTPWECTDGLRAIKHGEWVRATPPKDEE